MNRNYLLFAIMVLVLTLGCKKDNEVEVETPTTPDDMGMVEDMDDDVTSKIDTMTTVEGVQFVRTPAERFENLPNWPYAYQYVEIDGLRQAYAEAGPANGEVVLLLHGQPSWSYLYRKMIPVLADAGYRVIAMDHLGMGRSDKPIDIENYSYLGHNDRLERFIEGLGLRDINLFVQDWGSLIGLRVAGLNPDWFATIAVGDGNLPVVPAGIQPIPAIESPNETDENLVFPFGEIPAQQPIFYDGCELIVQGNSNFSESFAAWATYSMKGASFKPSEVLEALTWFDLPAEVEAAYDAPYPSRAFMAGVRTFPSLVNQLPGQNDEAWAGLTAYEKPFVTIWANNDAGSLGACETQQRFIDEVPGAAEKPHARLPEAGHFLQDDQGAEIARRLVEFYRGNYDAGEYAFGNNNTVIPDEVCEDDFSLDPRRYCELILVKQENGEVTAEVWGTQGFSSCPTDCWDNLDLAAIQTENDALAVQKNGPRIWLPGGNGQLPQLGTRFFGNMEMRRLASLVIDPAVLMEGQNAERTYYTESTVLRNSVYIFPANSMVYELTSPEGKVYIMQSVSLEINPNLRVDNLPTIGSVLNLPMGWSYQARTLMEELRLVIEGEATVLQDDLQNTYQLITPESIQPADGMGQSDITYESTLEQLDLLDKGGRWLAQGIKEIQEIDFLPDAAKDGLSQFLYTLAMNPVQRCNEIAHNQVFTTLANNNIPEEVVNIIQNAITRVCSPLTYHEGYWVSTFNNGGTMIEVINDVHVDAATNSITVYAQARTNGQILSPAQVGPGECTVHVTGDTVSFHPNAVYLNGSGVELMEADGTGAWWVKHAWIVDGEGYTNWELGNLEKVYDEGQWVTCELQEDGITMKIGDLDESENGAFNVRQPLLDATPIAFQINSNLNEQSRVIHLDCTENVSDFDGLARSCPVLIE